MQTKDFAAATAAAAPDSAEHARAAPLYERLPHGPHRLDRGEVLLHQRTRIQGAMVRGRRHGGYHGTSVKQVIALAGVSRRSFYEQFANKEDCFLATFEQIAVRCDQQRTARLPRRRGRARGAAARGLHAARLHDRGGPSRRRPGGPLLGDGAAAQGWRGCAPRSRRASGCSRARFAQAPSAAPLPAPIMRAIAGGVHGMLAGGARGERGTRRAGGARGGAHGWTMCLCGAHRAGSRRAARGTGAQSALRPASSRPAAQGGGARRRARRRRARPLRAASDVRERLLECGAAPRRRWATSSSSTAPQIAERRGRPGRALPRAVRRPRRLLRRGARALGASAARGGCRRRALRSRTGRSRSAPRDRRAARPARGRAPARAHARRGAFGAGRPRRGATSTSPRRSPPALTRARTAVPSKGRWRRGRRGRALAHDRLSCRGRAHAAAAGAARPPRLRRARALRSARAGGRGRLGRAAR